MTKLSMARRSSASVGRFLLEVIKPTPNLSSLGKRTREEHSVDSDDETTRVAGGPQGSSAPLLALAAPAPASRIACVALQNEDTTEDAIVITALDVIPFCCHADLVTMTRPQLLVVADTMNAKLPLAMQIDTLPARSDASIRHSIELLVGIRDAMPDSPCQTEFRRSLRRSRIHSALSAVSNDLTPTTPLGIRTRSVPPSPASPLASRSRSRVLLSTPSLAVLREDSEEGRSEPRPPKRRRTDALTFDPKRTISPAQSRRVTPLLGNANAESTPRYTSAAAVRAHRIRSQSQPVSVAVHQLNTNLHRTPTGPFRRSGYTRGGAMAAPRSRSTNFAMTSTPKNYAAAAVNSPKARGAARQFRPFLAELQNTKDDSASDDGGAESTADIEGHMEEMTFGIEGMTIPIVNASQGEWSVSADISRG